MIYSRTNPFIKNIKSLKDKKNRDEQNLFIVNGVKLVNEVLQSEFKVKAVIGTESALKEVLPFDNETEVTESVFESISTEVTPQGVLAVVEKPEEKPFVKSKTILLDNVSDPANVGAIIRTAAASGYRDVFMIDSADPFGPKAVRASMGGIFKVNVHAVERLKAKEIISLPFVIADMKGKNIFDFKLNEDFCLVIGNEANGVSEKLKSEADYTVSIPMENGMESLNASVSAGILMYLLKK